VEVREQFPVVLGVEGLDFAFAVDDELQRRRLDAPDRDEVVAELAGRQRQEAGQRRPPHEVDDLPCLAGGRQVEVQVVGVGERVRDLAFGDRGEPDALYRHVGLVGDDLPGLLADEFALAVVVGRDDRLVGPPREFTERRDDVFLRGRFHDVGVDEFDGFDVAPVAVLRGEVDADDVAGEADDPFPTPPVDVDAVHAVDLGTPLAQEFGDAPRCVVLLRDDQLHDDAPPGTRALIGSRYGHSRSKPFVVTFLKPPEGAGVRDGVGVRAHAHAVHPFRCVTPGSAATRRRR